MENIIHEDLVLGGRIVHHIEKNIVIATSWGDHSEEVPYKKYFETFLKTYPYESNANLIIDTSQLTKSTSSNRAWFSTNVAPRFFKGFANPENIKIAIVIPKSLFEKLAIDILIKAAKVFGQKAELKTFTDIVEAEAFVLGKS